MNSDPGAPPEPLPDVSVPGDPADNEGLIGRESDLDGLAALTRPGTVTTIAGVGGVGKSTVARALLARPADRLTDGWMCDLASVFDADAVAATVEDAIGAVRQEDVSSFDSVVATLRGRTGLLVLDNVEQVVGGAATLIERLRVECPSLAVLSTSREILRVPDEQVWTLDPLDVEREAPELFVRHARLADPDFDPDRHRDVVAEICRALDGLPLAIELAAAQLSSMSIDVLASRLDQRFRVLRDDGRDDRQATLAATVRWSHDLLDPSERRLFDRLSIFQGGFEVDAARNVLDPGDRNLDVDQILENLADRSMLVRSRRHPGRFEMLETLRHLGDRHLAERGERSSTRNAHLDHVVNMSAEISARCYGEDWSTGLERLGVEWDNIRSALNWAIDTQRDSDVDRLLRDLFFISRWTVETEPATWSQRLFEGTHDGARAGAPSHLHLAHSLFVAGEHLEALAQNEAALRKSATPSDRSWARYYAAVELQQLGRLDEAAAMTAAMVGDVPPRHVEQAMQLAAHAVAHLNAGTMDLADVTAAVDRAAAMAAETRNPVAIGQVAHNRGLVAVAAGDPITGDEQFEAALSLARTHQIRSLTADVLAARTYAPGYGGLAAAKHVLDDWQRDRDVGNEFLVLEAAGINLAEIGDIESAAVILGNLDQDGRRLVSSSLRRQAATRVIEARRGSDTWKEQGAALTRLELLDFARNAVTDALSR